MSTYRASDRFWDDQFGLLTIHRDIQVLKTYGAAPYAAALKRLEKEIKERQSSVNEKIGSFSTVLHSHARVA